MAPERDDLEDYIAERAKTDPELPARIDCVLRGRTTTAQLIARYRAHRAEARNAEDLTDRFAAEDAAAAIFDELIRREDAGDTEAGAFLDGAWRDESGCPWTSADECATAAERSVAGTNDPIPGCVTHHRAAEA